MKLIQQYIYVIIPTLIVGILLGWLFFGGSNQSQESSHDHEHQEKLDETIYTCSMHPQIKQNKMGLCPICAMDLVPMITMGLEGEDVSPYEIMMTKAAASLANIQTLKVEEGTPVQELYLQGKVQADERNMAEITARFGGRIEKLYVNYTGQQVKKGALLASIYSPDLVNAQKELLEAFAFKESRSSLYLAAKAKLKSWDLSDAQIASIEKKGKPQLYFDVLSPISGTVSARHVTVGDYVKEGKGLFKVVDLTSVWVLFDAYESDLAWMKLGDEINFKLASIPSQEFSGKISYIDPFINAKTRVVQARVEMENHSQLMKPEMFASGVLSSKIAENSREILVPKSAILWTGKRAVVYVKVPERASPTFLYREVVLGATAGDQYVIISGLELGEEIAVNGVFKIDAAAQLSGLPSMMNPEAGSFSSGHQHGEMAHMEEADDVFMVYGNCSMCKERIEKAALSVEGIDQAIWDEDSKMLHLNHQEMDMVEVHKAVALVGHDTDLETSSDEVYQNLHECCKYARAQDRTQTEIKVYGNCDMCKERIESTVLAIDGVLKAEWDSETSMLQISFHSEEVSLDEIHEKIAAVGHDTEMVRAPNEVYEQLHECCKYERK